MAKAIATFAQPTTITDLQDAVTHMECAEGWLKSVVDRDDLYDHGINPGDGTAIRRIYMQTRDNLKKLKKILAPRVEARHQEIIATDGGSK